jgi:hypothetical protein
MLTGPDRFKPFNRFAEPVTSGAEGFKPLNTKAGSKRSKEESDGKASTFREFSKRRNGAMLRVDLPDSINSDWLLQRAADD